MCGGSGPGGGPEARWEELGGEGGARVRGGPQEIGLPPNLRKPSWGYRVPGGGTFWEEGPTGRQCAAGTASQEGAGSGLDGG